MFDVKDKIAVVTGGGGVLCGAMAQALAQGGATVAVLDLMEEAANKVAAQCGNGSIGVKCDVLSPDSIKAAAQTVVEKLGRVDILVNGAGGNKPAATAMPGGQSFFDIPPDAFQWVFNLNIMGTILPSQIFGKVMAEQGSGIIINISSMNAFRPLTRIAAYSAAKAAVSNFTQWLAVHMNQNYSKKIRVNAIAPGFFLTEQNRFLLTDKETGELTARGKQIIEHTPMGEFGTPDDLVGALLWLCSEQARFVNGIILPIDGGFSAFAGV